MSKRTKKTLSIDAALLRLRKYCAFTERTTEEVKKKMVGYGLSDEDKRVALEKLVKEGFINETRFASAFAGGKFRIKKWGRKKIEVEMRRKGLPDELINKGLKELKEEDYVVALDELLKRKWAQILRKEPADADYETRLKNKQKLMRYGIQKGYEHQLVMDRVSRLLK